MALAHSLSMATPASPAQVAGELHDLGRNARLFDASATPERLLDEGVADRSGMWIRVAKARPRPWSPLVTDLGVTPTVHVAFEPDTTGDIGIQEDDVIRLVAGLLARLRGDAVLQYHHEIVWLLRRGDDLSLNERDDLWPARRLTLMFHPYRRATHTFSED